MRSISFDRTRSLTKYHNSIYFKTYGKEMTYSLRFCFARWALQSVVRLLSVVPLSSLVFHLSILLLIHLTIRSIALPSPSPMDINAHCRVWSRHPFNMENMPSTTCVKLNSAPVDRLNKLSYLHRHCPMCIRVRLFLVILANSSSTIWSTRLKKTSVFV